MSDDAALSKMIAQAQRRRYPGIPEPSPTLQGLYQTVRALKEAVELLNGQRGDNKEGKVITSTVTWADLLELGLIERDQIPRRK